MAIDLKTIIKKLEQKRPVFHSEADFQHSLAWEIQCSHPSAQIRLERPLSSEANSSKRSYLDILVVEDGIKYAIELKYKTCGLNTVVAGEEFNLPNQGGHNNGKYDFLKDISRLEKIKECNQADFRYAIMLTNERLYWFNTERDDTLAWQFSIHDDSVLEQGEHAWSPLIRRVKSDRSNPIVLNQSYNLKWQEYSQVEDSRVGKFRYLFLEV